jgi:mannose-6-phosphate isomerase-like protein (cupin superfamily)
MSADETLTVGGDEMRLRLTSAASDGAAIAFDVEMAPGGGPPVLHRHPSLEIYRVVEGELCLHLGTAGGGIERRIVGEGEVAFIPGGAEHTVRNESDQPARAFAVLCPGTELEAFARAAAQAEHERVPELAARAGIEITRPIEAG